MERDIRQTKLYKEVEEYFRAVHAPGEGVVSDAADVCMHPDGRRVALTGTIFNDLTSAPATRVCLVEMDAGKTTVLSCPRNNDRLPRWSPDGRWLAYLSDRREGGSYQLYLSGSDAPDRPAETPSVDGFVEYLHWSPDSTKLLLGVAGSGVDLAGCQGGMTVSAEAPDLPSWLPEIDTGDAPNRWRSLYVHDLESGTTSRVSRDGLNYWEASWCGNDAIAAIVSRSHSEGSWYQAYVIQQKLKGGDIRQIFSTRDQVGLPSASPSGEHISIVEAICSDRLIVCGTLLLVDVASGDANAIDTNGVEVTHTIWRDDRHLLFAGHRGLETVVGEYILDESATTVHWSGAHRTIGAWYPSVWPSPRGGAVGIAESYETAPEVAEFRDGDYRAITSFATRYSRDASFSKARVEAVSWHARDGLEIQGWLIRPQGEGRHPLVVDIHGGPVWQCRNRWAGRLRGAKVLADYGIASLFPNPRGSSGRGQDFARLVKGDMGGEDTYDYLSGCDAMVERGIADPDRLGVTGSSYGGFMSAWLITRDSRFAAAVAVSCISDWYSQHRTSQIPCFDELFLDDSAYQANGKFFERSPAMFTANARTPTLQLTGELDKNTPPSQALEFHRSLLDKAVESVLVTYPTAGHGILTFPEVIDATARRAGWFLTHFGIEPRDA